MHQDSATKNLKNDIHSSTLSVIAFLAYQNYQDRRCAIVVNQNSLFEPHN